MGPLREALRKAWVSLAGQRAQAGASVAPRTKPAPRVSEGVGGAPPPSPPGQPAYQRRAQPAAAAEALARIAEYKEPEPWVQNGLGIQAPGSETGRALSVRMGIDFGTAFTKVEMRAAQASWLVDWHGIRSGGHSFLLPSEFSVLPDGVVRLGQAPGGAQIVAGLKLPFILEEAINIEQLARASVYLAWVMRYCRAWIYNSQLPLLKPRRIAWSLTLGVPAATWSFGRTSEYERVARCAWDLSQQGDRGLTLRAARDLLLGGRTQASALGSVEVVPELAAQVTWYVRSPMRREGLHLLVDVGAGTLDLATFNAYMPPEGPMQLPVMENRVLPLGTHFLAAHRIRAAGSAAPPDDMADVSGDAAADGGFRLQVANAVHEILGVTKARRYPGAPEWSVGMQVFLFGGGAGCPVYRRAVVEGFGRLGVARPRFIALPQDRRLPSRTSVAQGLSYGKESIAEMIPPHETEDIGRAAAQTARPDRDELYPK